MEIFITIASGVVSPIIVGVIMVFVVNRQAKNQEAREQARAELLVSMLETTNASLSLGQAMATELTEIGKCNGKTTAAMKYAAEAKHRQEDGLRHNAAANF